MNKREINIEMKINADIRKVWAAWTTEAGVSAFFAPQCKIDLRIWGAYELYFDVNAAPGSRGGEGVKILAFEEPYMFSFSWNAPPHLPEIRHMQTHVLLYFKSLSPTQTAIRFSHDGWGEGETWDKAFAYFENAWRNIVFPRFKYAMEIGPVDWQNPPSLNE